MHFLPLLVLIIASNSHLLFTFISLLLLISLAELIFFFVLFLL